jgi:hypothetical protein
MTSQRALFFVEIIMFKRLLPSYLPAASLIFFSSLLANLPAGATTVAPPANLGHLARISGTVVFAAAIESRVDESGDLPTTVTRFQLLRPVAGADTGALFEVREPGGRGEHRAAAVAGAPRFEAGRNYLLFLDRAPDDRWQARMMSYGILAEAPGGELLAPLPEADRIEVAAGKSYEPVGVYRKELLLGHLRDVARGAAWNRQQVEAQPLQTKDTSTAVAGAAYTAPASCVFITDDTDGLPIRWFGYETNSATSTVMATTPGQTGIADGGVGAVQAGTGAWTNHPDSIIRFNFGGTRARNLNCSGNFDYDTNAVVFNDPCGDISDLSSCVGTLAFGGAIYDPANPRAYDGQSWHQASSTFVVVNNDAQCVGETSFKEVVSHELGHTQGFGHHTPPNPADALMSAKLKADGLGAALRSQDKICAEFAYHTFLDVPYASTFWKYIEAIEDAGVTAGCQIGSYCPASFVTRAQMALFLVRALHGSSFVPPPASGTVYADVPASDSTAPYIEQLAREGIALACQPGYYCPSNYMNRTDMSVFLERAKRGGSYTPPPASGTLFTDVPASYPQAAFIEQLSRDGITTGCATNPNRYCPVDSVSRDQMAAFLARTFALPLP